MKTSLRSNYMFPGVPSFIMDPMLRSKQPKRLETSNYGIHSLFDCQTTKILEGLNLVVCNDSTSEDREVTPRPSIDDQPSTESIQADFEAKLSVSDIKFCNTCQTHFADREEQLLHYKSDWHRYNLHLRLKGAQSVTEEKFEEILGDVSSISGSDEDDIGETSFENSKSQVQVEAPVPNDDIEEASPTKQRSSHKVFFTNATGELICLHRCLLHHKKNPLYGKSELVSATTDLPSKSKWAVLMVSCGHFAGAIFNKNGVLEHKTFHRYTVRKKRGTAQSSHDNKGHHANSAGANLRRYNEAALVQDVQELLGKWTDLLSECHYIFMRVPVANRAMFFTGKKAPLHKDDERIRVIPFPTRRPTFSELKRVQQVLASVESFGKAEALSTLMPRSPQRIYDKVSGQLQVRDATLSPRAASRKSKPRQERTDEDTTTDMAKTADKDGPSRLADVVAEGEDGSGDEVQVGDMDLVEESVQIDFSHLKEFEVSPKRKRNKKKDTSTHLENFSLDEHEIRWRNSLFAACKTGNETIFNTIMNEMTLYYKQNTEASSFDNSANGIQQSSDIAPPSSQDSSCTSVGMEATSLDNTLPAGTEATSSDNTLPAGTVLASDCPTNKQHKEKDVQTVADFLNRPLSGGSQTLLHTASKEGQAQIVHLLLERGSNPALKDKGGKLAYNLGTSDVRDTFRRFMSAWPDRYDYAAAQVPSPLTEEMEAEKKRKLAEKRRAKKKAANERNKEKKAAEAIIRQEEEEKNRFIALSDREKRALAAERRLVQQHASEGMSAPVLNRCWQCGEDITGKVPFEYSDFKFCTTKCLREHRSNSKK